MSRKLLAGLLVMIALCVLFLQIDTPEIKAPQPVSGAAAEPEVNDGTQGVYAGAEEDYAEKAIELAKREIDVLKKLGLLKPEIAFDDNAGYYTNEAPEVTLDRYFYGRTLPERYELRGGNEKYYLDVMIDKSSEKLIFASIEAIADESLEPVSEENFDGQTWKFYDNFSDIVPEDMTVGRFCDILGDYWGFGPYSFMDRYDDAYSMDMDAPEGTTLIGDLPNGNYFASVIYEGDQEGVPMYVQAMQFPGRVCLTFGESHAVG